MYFIFASNSYIDAKISLHFIAPWIYNMYERYVFGYNFEKDNL